VMAAEFGGMPVSNANFSEWKRGGYQDWLAEQESLSGVGFMLEEAREFEKLGEEDLMERLALWLSVRCAIEARKQRAPGADPALGMFGRLCRGLAALRRGKHTERRVELDEARLELEKTRLDLSMGPNSKKMEKLFWEWTERPDIKKKLFGEPMSQEERAQAYYKEFGLKWNPYAKTPEMMPPEQRAEYERRKNGPPQPPEPPEPLPEL
jgi:hypothetical protein